MMIKSKSRFLYQELAAVQAAGCRDHSCWTFSANYWHTEKHLPKASEGKFEAEGS